MTINYAELGTQELFRRQNELRQETGHLEEELNRRRSQNRCVIRSSELEWRNIGKYQEVKGERFPLRVAHAVNPILGFNVHNFASFITEVPPRAEVGAYHMHGEAIKYYIKGKAIEIIGDKQYEVNPGDIVFIPANTWHGTQNAGDEPLQYFAVAQSTTPTLIQPVYKIREDLRK